jgi:hypothetical protein
LLPLDNVTKHQAMKGVRSCPHKTAMSPNNYRVKRVLFLISMGLWVWTASFVAAEQIPLPRPRPHNIDTPGPVDLHGSGTGWSLASASAGGPEADASLASPATPEGPAVPSACQLRLTSDLAVMEPLPPIIGPGECGAVDVVRLDAIVLPDHTKVAVTPPATLRCVMAEAVVHWVREEVAPAAVQLRAPLRGLENYDSFECRSRNRVPGAKISEHGHANALDVKSFKLADGVVIGPTDVNVERSFRESLRHSACARFNTVLGPGSDGYHENHIHIDLADRRNSYRICQWDVRDPLPPESETVAEDVPLPRPRPTARDLPRFTTAGSKF